MKVPTLVADGMEDALDPVSNDRQLAGLIKGAQLALYPARAMRSGSRTRAGSWAGWGRSSVEASG